MFRNPLTDGLVVLVVLLLFFGPKRLPMLSRSIGESIKEFRGGLSTRSSGGEDKDKDKPQISADSGAPAEAPSAPPAHETAESGTEHRA